MHLHSLSYYPATHIPWTGWRKFNFSLFFGCQYVPSVWLHHKLILYIVILEARHHTRYYWLASLKLKSTASDCWQKTENRSRLVSTSKRFLNSRDVAGWRPIWLLHFILLYPTTTTVSSLCGFVYIMHALASLKLDRCAEGPEIFPGKSQRDKISLFVCGQACMQCIQTQGRSANSMMCSPLSVAKRNDFSRPFLLQQHLITEHVRERERERKLGCLAHCSRHFHQMYIQSSS